MIYLFAAMMSFGLVALGIALISVTLHGSGLAILSAMAGEPLFAPLQPRPRVRRTVRFRTTPVSPMRAAA